MSNNDLLPVHPLAKLSPNLSKQEFENLCTSIQTTGLIETIKVYKGQVIDGRHRMHALKKIGWPIKPYVETITELKGSVEAFIVDSRRARGHNSKSQIASFCSKVLERTPGSSKIAKRRQLAKDTGVSESTIKQAEIVHRKASEEVKRDLDEGVIGIAKAYESVRVPARSEQPKDVKKKASSSVLDDAIVNVKELHRNLTRFNAESGKIAKEQFEICKRNLDETLTALKDWKTALRSNHGLTNGKP